MIKESSYLRLVVADDTGIVKVMYPLLKDIDRGVASRINSVSRHSVPATALCYGNGKDEVFIGYRNGRIDLYSVPDKVDLNTATRKHSFVPPEYNCSLDMGQHITSSESSVSIDVSSLNRAAKALEVEAHPLDIRAMEYLSSLSVLIIITSDSCVHRVRRSGNTLSYDASFQMKLPNEKNASSKAWHIIIDRDNGQAFATCGGWRHAPKIYDALTGTLVYSPIPAPPSFPARVGPRFIATAFAHDISSGLFFIGDLDGFVHCYKSGLWGTDEKLLRLKNLSRRKAKGKEKEDMQIPRLYSNDFVRSSAQWRLKLFDIKVSALSIARVRRDSSFSGREASPNEQPHQESNDATMKTSLFLVVCNGEGQMDLLSAKTGKHQRRFKGHTGSIKSLASVLLYDDAPTSNGQLQVPLDDSDADASTKGSLVSSKDTLIATGALDKFIRVYTPKAQKPIAEHYIVSNPLCILPSFSTVHEIIEDSPRQSVAEPTTDDTDGIDLVGSDSSSNSPAATPQHVQACNNNEVVDVHFGVRQVEPTTRRHKK